MKYTVMAIVVGLALVVLAWAERGSVTVAPERDSAAWQYGTGDRDATKVIVWTDAECPFCAQLHATLKSVVDDTEGEVVWQYRHLPLANHRHARPAAYLAECLGDTFGNATFWQYFETVYANQSQITTDWLTSQAQALGLSTTQARDCLTDQSVATRIATDVQVAHHYGAAGTPFAVVLYPDRTYRVVRGALPHTQWNAILN